MVNATAVWGEVVFRHRLNILRSVTITYYCESAHWQHNEDNALRFIHNLEGFCCCLFCFQTSRDFHIGQWTRQLKLFHDDAINWKHFPRYWPFVREINRLLVNSPHKGQWRGALMFSLICAWENGWANQKDAGNLRRHRTHYDVIVVWLTCLEL